MSADLVCAGEAFEDLIFHGLERLPRPGEEARPPAFARTFGGGTLITAVAASRAGARVAVVSALPADAVPRLARERLRLQDLRRRDEPHAISVALSTRGDRAFVTFDGVNTVLEERLLTAFERRLPQGRHLHLALGPRDLSRWRRVLERCRARGITTSWDFGWHEDLPARRGFTRLLPALDWVFVNEREAAHYTGARTAAAARMRLASLTGGVVIKRGARGAVASADGAAWARVSAPRITVVDTTGAGDAFNGGFLAAHLKGLPLAACLRAGVHLGTRASQAAGGLDGLPAARELRASMRSWS